MSRKGTPEGWANRQRVVRARQRARHTIAMRHKAEYLAARDEIEAEFGNSVLGTTQRARAMQRVVNAHRAEFRAIQDAEEMYEGVERLPLGSRPIHACGSAPARGRHLRRGEPICEACERWYYELHKKRCAICDTEFSVPQRLYCSEDCACLALYLRYWVQSAGRKRQRKPMPARAAQARAERRGLNLDALVARAEYRAIVAS